MEGLGGGGGRMDRDGRGGGGGGMEGLRGGGGGGIEEGGGGTVDAGGGACESLFSCRTSLLPFFSVSFCVLASSLGILENLRSVSIGTNAVMAPAFCTGVDST